MSACLTIRVPETMPSSIADLKREEDELMENIKVVSDELEKKKWATPEGKEVWRSQRTINGLKIKWLNKQGNMVLEAEETFFKATEVQKKELKSVKEMVKEMVKTPEMEGILAEIKVLESEMPVLRARLNAVVTDMSEFLELVNLQRQLSILREEIGAYVAV